MWNSNAMTRTRVELLDTDLSQLSIAHLLYIMMKFKWRLTLGWILPMDNCNHFPYNNIYRNDTRLWLVHFSAINRPSDSCNFVRFWKTHVCMFFPHCTRNHTITHTNRTVKAFHVLKYRQDTQGVTALGFVAKSMWKRKEQRCMPLIAKFNSKTVGECHKAMGT